MPPPKTVEADSTSIRRVDGPKPGNNWGDAPLSARGITSSSRGSGIYEKRAPSGGRVCYRQYSIPAIGMFIPSVPSNLKVCMFANGPQKQTFALSLTRRW